MMDKIFKELLDIPEVWGVVYQKKGGVIQYHYFRQGENYYNLDHLRPLLRTLAEIQEADMIFANLRLYLRQFQAGHLLVVMSTSVPIAMVRLHCDMIIPQLIPATKPAPKKFWGIFRS